MRKEYCITMCLVLVLACCKRDITPAPQIFTKDSFPLAQGNWWRYQLYTLYGNDTFTIRVDSVVYGSPYTKYFCYYIGVPSNSPAGYFLQSDTSMSFTNTAMDPYYTAFQNFYLRFPASMGNVWHTAVKWDSIKVEGINKCNSADSSFSTCYSLVETFDVPHILQVKSMLITPKVGVIESAIDFNSDTADASPGYSGGVQIKQHITLIDYHVQ